MKNILKILTGFCFLNENIVNAKTIKKTNTTITKKAKVFKVFYNPKTLEIKGYSDGTIVMQFPYIETTQDLTLLWNFKIKNGKVKPIRTSFTKEEWELINKNGKL